MRLDAPKSPEETDRVCRAVLDEATARLEAREAAGVAVWPRSVPLAAAGLGIAESEAAQGLASLPLVVFARVAQQTEDPRAFALAELPAGEAALLWPLGGGEWGDEAFDVVALSLSRRRFWRLTGGAAMMADDSAKVRQGGVLRLRQSVHGFVADMIRHQAREARAERAGREAYERVMIPVRHALGAADALATMRTPEEPAARARFLAAFRTAREAKGAAEAAVRRLEGPPPPAGAAVLAPAELDWSARTGLLKDIEAVEILDAPASGPLGRALRVLNPRLGTRRGVALWGTETGGRAAA